MMIKKLLLDCAKERGWVSEDIRKLNEEIENLVNKD